MLTERNDFATLQSAGESPLADNRKYSLQSKTLPAPSQFLWLNSQSVFSSAKSPSLHNDSFSLAVESSKVLAHKPTSNLNGICATNGCCKSLFYFLFQFIYLSEFFSYFMIYSSALVISPFYSDLSRIIKLPVQRMWRNNFRVTFI